MDIRNDTHTVRFDWGTVVYWQGNSACGQDDPWTHCDVSPAGAASGYPHFTFQRVDEHRMKSLLHAFELAFHAGERRRSADLRTLLGCAPETR